MKDYCEITCKCGRRFTQPYFDVLFNFSREYVQRQIAPSLEQVKNAHHWLEIDYKYHQNKDCPWMYSERRKAELATHPQAAPAATNTQSK